MNTVALEDMTTLVIMTFCENLAELGHRESGECDLWYRNLTDEQRYEISEKLLDIIRRDMDMYKESEEA